MSVKDIVTVTVDGVESPGAADFVEFVMLRSFGLSLTADGQWLRQRVNYLANGEIDHSRSHYSLNGRRISRARYRQIARQE